MDDKPWGSSLREKLPRSVRLQYVNWGSKECQQMLLRRQECGAAVPRVLAEQLSRRQRPWRRSAAVPWRPPTQGRTWPPPPLCGAKGHGAAKLICGTRVHGTVAWARPLPRWRRGGLGATLAGSAVPPTMAPQSCAAVPWLVAPQNGLGFENTFGHRLFSQFF